MPPLKPNKPTITDPEKCNRSEEQHNTRTSKEQS